MATKLKNLKITEGSLVDKGANEDAEVVLFKREGGLIDKIKQTFKKFFDGDDEAKDFSEVLEDKERFEDLWTLDDALRVSVNSILHDDSLSALDKQTKIAETLTQYLQELMTSGIIKIGRKISSGRMSVLKELMDSMTKAVSDLEVMLIDIEGTQEGVNMPIDKDVLKDLPEDVQEEITALQKKADESSELIEKNEELTAKVTELEKSEETDEEQEDILKGASEEVIAKMAELTEKVTAAENIAKTEQEARITKEYEDKAEKLDKIPGTTEEIAKQLRTAHEAGDEKLEETLTAINKQLEESDLFKEVGSGVSGETGDADAKINAGAAEIAKRDGISQEQGVVKFLETEAGKELYKQRTVN